METKTKMQKLVEKLRIDREKAYEKYVSRKQKEKEEKLELNRLKKEERTLKEHTTESETGKQIQTEVIQNERNGNAIIEDNYAIIGAEKLDVDTDMNDKILGPSNKENYDDIVAINRSTKRKRISKEKTKDCDTETKNNSLIKKTHPKKRATDQKKQTTAYKTYRKNANERNRKYLSNMTEEQSEERKKKKREAYRKKKEAKEIKLIADLTPRQQRERRKYWKNAAAKSRAKKTQLKNILADTPSESDAEDQIARQVTPSSQKQRGNKIRARNRALMKKELDKKDLKILELKRKLNTLRKAQQRRKKNKIVCSPSPKTKVANMIRGCNISRNIQKELIFGESLKLQLKKNSAEFPVGSKEHQVFNKCVSGDIFKKNKVQHMAEDIITQKQIKKFRDDKQLLDYVRKKKNTVMTEAIQQEIIAFFEKDSVSRMCPGKKDVVVKNQLRKQKRLLLKDINDVHKSFIEEKAINISYSSFWRYKPFWVVPPKAQDRNTCLCVKHSNMELLTAKLRNLGISKSGDPEDLLDELCCDIDNVQCAMNSCDKCSKSIIDVLCSSEDQKEIEYSKWVTQTEDKIIKGTVKKIKITKKITVQSTRSQLIKVFNDELPTFKKHVFYANHQMNTMQEKRLSLISNELFLQIDFSENYVAKSYEEIQSMHFGASKRQISLHTGVAYYLKRNNVSHLSFTTVSDNLEHGAHSIWAHLNPILKMIINDNPGLDTIHFFSDGPTSQYRNRFNLYLLLQQTNKYFPTIRFISWNYSESGHGKGAMDGVGGSLKRNADRFVRQGNDITSAKDFVRIFNEVKVSKTKVILIEDHKIDDLKKELPQKIPSVPNVMNVHQVTYSKNLSMPRIFLRNLSCFECPFGSICEHYPADKSFVDFVLLKQSILFFNRYR